MKQKKVLVFAVLLLFIILFFYFENNIISITNISLSFHRLPGSFDGYRIVHLSDLHNKRFGSNQEHILEEIKKAKPDIIVITGDLVDSRNYDEEASCELVTGCMDIAQVYYVTGNHEWRSGKFNSLEKKIKNSGAKILRNNSSEIKQGNDSIHITGIDDPSLSMEYMTDKEIVSAELKKAVNENSSKPSFTILLSHRPELFSEYKKINFDLIFSGHAHGGQVRLPFIGGLAAPDQGLFPKYTDGKYVEDNSVMVVSRGLGNSIIPQRIFNRPEIVVVTLRSSKTP